MFYSPFAFVSVETHKASVGGGEVSLSQHHEDRRMVAEDLTPGDLLWGLVFGESQCQLDEADAEA